MAHYEMHGWPKEAGRLDRGFKGVRKIICDWGERATLADSLLLTEYPYLGTGALCRYITIQPLGGIQAGGAAAEATYEKAVLTAEYTTYGPRFRSGTHTLLSEIIETSRESRQLNSKKLKWKDGTAVEDNERFPMLHAGFTYHLKYHNAISIPTSVLQYEGYLNATATTAYWFGLTFAARTLMYMGPRMSHFISSGGNNRYGITHTFVYRYNNGYGHNGYLRQSTMTYQPLYIKGTSTQLRLPEVVFNF